MNPLERLRYIARIEGDDPLALAIETSYVLADLAFDNAILVTALRRLLDRHGNLGIMWMLASRVATSIFPEDEIWNLLGELTAQWEANDANESLIPPFIALRSDGRVTVADLLGNREELELDPNQVGQLVAQDINRQLIIESELVSSGSVVVNSRFSEIFEAHFDYLIERQVILMPGFRSLVPSSIQDSLASRIGKMVPGSTESMLVRPDDNWSVLIDGSLMSIRMIDRVIDWKVPQEILRSAGPLLG